MSENNNYHHGDKSINNLKIEKVESFMLNGKLQPYAAENSELQHNGVATSEFLRIQGERFDILQQKFSMEISKMNTRLAVMFSQIERMEKHLNRDKNNEGSLPG